jgi:hypothetical protein
VGFEPTILAFERAKIVHALEGAVTVIDIVNLHSSFSANTSDLHMRGTMFEFQLGRRFGKNNRDFSCGVLGYGNVQSSGTLKTNATVSSETLVTTYQTARCHNREGHNVNLLKPQS